MFFFFSKRSHLCFMIGSLGHIQPVSYKRYFRCNNCFLLLMYTINLSLSTVLVDPPPIRTFYMKHALSEVYLVIVIFLLIIRNDCGVRNNGVWIYGHGMQIQCDEYDCMVLIVRSFGVLLCSLILTICSMNVYGLELRSHWHGVELY